METQENENTGSSLLKKRQKGLLRALFSRLGIIVLLLLLQIFALVFLFRTFEAYAPHVYTAMTILAIAVVLYLINSSIDPTAKVTWLIIITLTPVFGGLLLLYTHMDVGHRAVKDVMSRMVSTTRDAIPQDPKAAQDLEQESPASAALARYISRSGCYPVYGNTEVTYFPLGEDKFAELLIQLERAERFIFLEYFIIDEGFMWGHVLDILARKARAGVDVRVMYDGTCEFSTLSRDYPKLLKGLGIQCKVFSPATPFLSTHYNYRDHRKILVIDGHTAFTGGINLADEYINRVEKYGHWKDTAIMLQGEAVKSFTLMFLQIWNILSLIHI